MATPAFIELPGSIIIGTNQLLEMRLDGKTVLFDFGEGKIVSLTYATSAAAAVAYAAYKAALIPV